MKEFMEHMEGFLSAVFLLFRMIAKECVKSFLECTGIGPLWKDFSKGERLYWQIIAMALILWIAMTLAIARLFGAGDILVWSSSMAMFASLSLIGFVICPEKVVYWYMRLMRGKKSSNPFQNPPREEKHRFATIVTRWLFRRKFLEDK